MNSILFTLLLSISVLSAAADLIPTISATQPSNWYNWSTVTVNYNITSPLPTDWIGAFIENYNPTYIQYKNVSTTQSTLNFTLLNGRHSYIFKYYRGNTVLATSNTVSPLAASPNQGHLSYVPNLQNAMIISWTSSLRKGQVSWGLSKSNLVNTINSTTDTYNANDFTSCMNISSIPPLNTSFKNLDSHHLRCMWTCYNDPTSSELFLDPGVLHTATMSDLPSNTRIYYSFGNPKYHSPTYSFLSPSLEEKTFTFLVTGDMGIGKIQLGEEGGATDNDPPPNGADVVIASILSDPLTKSDEFILLNGDISYARGWSWIWERYFDLIQPLTTSMPMMVSVGNHEIDSHENPFVAADGGDSGGECGVVASKRFSHLESTNKMWYSFDTGSVHWIVLSTEHPIAQQIEFFKQDVLQLNRTRIKFLLVAMHRPLFVSNAMENEVALILRKAWHQLFVESGVDFVYTGHAHYYERICPIEMNSNNVTDVTCSTTKDRPIYIVDGTAGAEMDTSSPKTEITIYKEFGNWGYSRFYVTPTSLTFRHFRAQDHSLSDEVVLQVRK